MKSQSSIALKELLNESASIIEEFQAQCILMASEFEQISKGNFISDYDYPTFMNEVKTIRYFSTTVKKESSDVSQVIQDIEPKEGDTYFDSLLIEMAKRTRKPLGQSFMKKTRHTFPATPYKNIRARIVHLIAEGKIIDYSEQDNGKPKRGHPKTKVDAPVEKLKQILQSPQNLQHFHNLQQPKQLQQLQQQLQQIQQFHQVRQQQQQQQQQYQPQQLQIQQEQGNEQNQTIQNKQDQNSQGELDKQQESQDILKNEIDEAAMAEDLSSDLALNQQYGSLQEMLDDDSFAFELSFPQEENNSNDLSESHQPADSKEPEKNEAEASNVETPE